MKFLKEGISKIKDQITKTDLQRKLKEATSNEHCHANVSLLNEIAEKTHNYNDFQVILTYVVKRLESSKEKWRRILKTLLLIEHILKTGSPNFVDAMRSESYKIKNLYSFSYIDTNRSDKGETIREKSKVIVSLLNDREKLKSEREDYAKWRSRIEGVSSNGSASISSANYFAGSSYSSSTKPSSVSYLDRRNDDRYDRKKEENKKPVKEDSSSSSGSESEEKDKKNKHKPKKVKKESESSEDEHNPDILNNYSKKEEIKPQETKDNLSTSHISIKKPGMKQTPQSTTNPTGDLLFSSDNTPNSNATNDINDIFGFGTGTGSKTQSTNVQPQMNQFPEIFDVKQKETKTHNPFLIDFTNTSAPTTTTATTSQPISGNTSNDLIKNLNSLNSQPNTNQPQSWGNPNMTYPTNPQFNQQGTYVQPNNFGYSQPTYGGYNQPWGNPQYGTQFSNPQGFYQPQVYPQPQGYSQPSLSYQQSAFTQGNQKGGMSNQSKGFDDNDFKEVVEDNPSYSNRGQFEGNKSGLSGLLDSKLVDLNSLGANKTKQTNNHQNMMNFY